MKCVLFTPASKNPRFRFGLLPDCHNEQFRFTGRLGQQTLRESKACLTATCAVVSDHRCSTSTGNKRCMQLLSHLGHPNPVHPPATQIVRVQTWGFNPERLPGIAQEKPSRLQLIVSAVGAFNRVVVKTRENLTDFPAQTASEPPTMVSCAHLHVVAWAANQAGLTNTF